MVLDSGLGDAGREGQGHTVRYTVWEARRETIAGEAPVDDSLGGLADG